MSDLLPLVAHSGCLLAELRALGFEGWESRPLSPFEEARGVMFWGRVWTCLSPCDLLITRRHGGWLSLLLLFPKRGRCKGGAFLVASLTTGTWEASAIPGHGFPLDVSRLFWRGPAVTPERIAAAMVAAALQEIPLEEKE